MERQFDCIVIGAGLSGRSAAYKLTKAKKQVLVLEKENILGGRTSSWTEAGMEIESGFHRYIGYYKHFPKLLKEVGINLNDILFFENEAEIKISKDKSIILGLSPFFSPIIFVKDIFSNRDILSLKDKLSILKLFVKGMLDYTIDADNLDNYSVLDYANKLKIEKTVIEYIATSLSTGIFFLPKEEYSAKMFFGLFYPAIFRFPLMRIGVYKKGMKDAFINPIATKITDNKGVIVTNTKVKKLLIKNKKVIGVKTNRGKFYAKNTILATDISNAKSLTKTLKGKEFRKLSALPTMSAITVQLELKERAMPLDRTTFTPNSLIASFTEESNTTFKKSKGRLSIILVSKKYLEKLSDKKILDLSIYELEKIGIAVKGKLLDYKVVRHIDKFYQFSPGNDHLRPNTRDSSTNLILAGDYTNQKWYSTMEGATLSGINAASLILENEKT